MGLLHYFLGIEIYQEDGVFIFRKRYVEHILKFLA